MSLLQLASKYISCCQTRQPSKQTEKQQATIIMFSYIKKMTIVKYKTVFNIRKKNNDYC